MSSKDHNFIVTLDEFMGANCVKETESSVTNSISWIVSKGDVVCCFSLSSVNDNSRPIWVFEVMAYGKNLVLIGGDLYNLVLTRTDEDDYMYPLISNRTRQPQQTLIQFS